MSDSDNATTEPHTTCPTVDLEETITLPVHEGYRLFVSIKYSEGFIDGFSTRREITTQAQFDLYRNMRTFPEVKIFMYFEAAIPKPAKTPNAVNIRGLSWEDLDDD